MGRRRGRTEEVRKYVILGASGHIEAESRLVKRRIAAVRANQTGLDARRCGSGSPIAVEQNGSATGR